MVLASTQAAVLSGMLALSGLAGENMVRDPGWYFMDIGRRLERAQQVTALLRATLTRSHSSAVDSLVVESVLAAGESGVTYRRRYRGRIQVATMLELLLLDAGNPRSLAYQVAQARADLRALPDSSGTSRPQRRLEDVEGDAAPRPAGRSSTGSTTAGEPPGAGHPARRARTTHSAESPMPLPPSTSGIRAPMQAARRRHAMTGCSDDRPAATASSTAPSTATPTRCRPRSGAGYLRPRDMPGQRCLQHTWRSTRPPSDISHGVDVYGNDNTYFHVTDSHTELRVVGTSDVEVDAPDLDPRGPGAALGAGPAVVDRRRRGRWSSPWPRRWSGCRPQIRDYARRLVHPGPPDLRGGHRPDPPDLHRVQLRVGRDVGVLDGHRRAGRRKPVSARTSRTWRSPACARSGWPAGTSPGTWRPTRRPARNG